MATIDRYTKAYFVKVNKNEITVNVLIGRDMTRLGVYQSVLWKCDNVVISNVLFILIK